MCMITLISIHVYDYIQVYMYAAYMYTCTITLILSSVVRDRLVVRFLRDKAKLHNDIQV